jgi:hypothetical protein
VVRNIGPYIPLWPMKWSSSIELPRPPAVAELRDDVGLALHRVGADGGVRLLAALLASIVRAARANLSPPSR